MSSARDEPNADSTSSFNPNKKLQRLIEAVRLPAGTDPRFVTGTVDVHRDEFTAAVHSIWKDVQAEAFRRSRQPETVKRLCAFYKSHGRKGFQQLMRVTKQLMRDTGVVGDVNAELVRAADAPREIEVERVFSERVIRSYDPALEQILRNAERDGAAFGSIDGCLWVSRASWTQRDQAARRGRPEYDVPLSQDCQDGGTYGQIFEVGNQSCGDRSKGLSGAIEPPGEQT
jgi:hypothetical protein